LSEEERREEVPEWMRDGLELKYVLKAISDFLRDIKEPLENILNSAMSLISGDRLGKDVGSFYKNLVESGVPEDMAKEMTKEYFESRIALVKTFRDLFSSLQSWRHSGGELGEEIKRKIHEVTGEALKEVKKED